MERGLQILEKPKREGMVYRNSSERHHNIFVILMRRQIGGSAQRQFCNRVAFPSFARRFLARTRSPARLRIGTIRWASNL